MLFMLIAGSTITIGQNPKPQPISFIKLKAGEEIVIDYKSTGCFHSEHREFRFTNSGATSVEAINVLHTQGDANQDILVRQPIKKFKLSKQDLTQLDRLLGFYRATPESGCTDVDRISVVLQRGSKIIASETFKDTSCFRSRKDILWLDKLVYRAYFGRYN